MTDKHPHSSPPAIRRAARRPAPPGRGFTIVELLVVLAIVCIMLALALPNITRAISNAHLGSAASSLAGAIQGARYQAISTGCPVNIAISTGTYQLTAEQVTGTPPACGTTFVNTGAYGTTGPSGPVPYASSEIVLSTNTTLQLNPSGTVTLVGNPAPANFSLVLSIGGTTTNGAPIKTINVSGVGNVKVQ